MSPPHPLHAFVDESTRRNSYIICAATVSTGDLHSTRKELKALLLPGQRRIHFTDESDSRRRHILKAMAEMNTTTNIYLAADSKRQDASRAAILEAMIPDLRSLGVQRLLLDSREGQDGKDRATIYKVAGRDPKPDFTYAHQQSAGEPLLWIPDAVGWAWGRAGQWKSVVESSGLVAKVIRVD